jgi:curved DNA-binding protein
MDFQDYYKTLGVERTAKAVDIKKAYRQLALKYHPDKNIGNPKAHDQFIMIQEAYEVLNDPIKKLKYDQLFDLRTRAKSKTYQTEYKSQANKGYSEYYNDDLYESATDDDSGIFSSFFKQFFSKKKKYDYSYLLKGKDLKGNIEIDLEEAFLGSNRIITVLNEKLRIKIKPGVKDEQVIKVKGKGAYGTNGAPRGDLIIKISVNNNPIFKRNGNDLFRDINVNVYTAILGGKVQFETLHGSVIIGIPEGTVAGTELRVKGKGMPKYSNPAEFGDLYVKILHKMPVRVTDEEKKLLKKLKEISNQKEGSENS